MAVAESRYDDAIIEFGRALDHDPDDEDARWNLELAWHMKNPSCAKRDDDHEPDNEPQLAKHDPKREVKDFCVQAMKIGIRSWLRMLAGAFLRR